MSLAYHSSSILIKMDQDDRQGTHGADLGLSISEMELMTDDMSEKIGSLHRGDHIRFNATMQSMGDTSHLHHLHLYDFVKIEGDHRDVEAHAHANGRYKVRIEPHDGKDHSHDEPAENVLVLNRARPAETTSNPTKLSSQTDASDSEAAESTSGDTTGSESTENQ